MFAARNCEVQDEVEAYLITLCNDEIDYVEFLVFLNRI